MQGAAVRLLISTFLAISLVPVAAESVVVQVAASSPSQPRNGSLQELLCSPASELGSSTTLQLDPGVHTIADGSTCVVADLSDVTITSLGGASIECESGGLLGSNFMFLNVSNLTMSNIRMDNCGRVIPQNLPAYVNNTFIYIDQEQKAVLVFSLVTNLCLVDFTITRSFGYSFVCVNLRGDAEFRGITIADTNNYRHPLCHRNETGLGCSGSGAVFIYSDPQNEGEFIPDPTTISIRDSNITNNENNIPLFRFAPVFLSIRGSFQLTRLLLTGTTGVAFYFGQRTYDVNVDIVSTVFSRNFGYSSTLGFLLFSTLRNLHIEVDGCVMEHNKGFELARGGGLLMLVVNYISDLSSFPDYPPNTHDLVRVRNTSFVENSADIGGAVYFYFTPQNVSDYSVVFDNVTFNGNRARVGTVIQVETRPATFIQSNYNVKFLDITASDNVLLNDVVSTALSEGSAAFVFNNIFNVTLSGRNHTHGSLISSNVPGAFLVVGGNLYLQGNVVFYNNTAQRGGAISLYDFSLLLIFEGSRITFSHNSAIQVGGAIHADSPGTGTSPTCTFQVIGPNRVYSVRDFDQLDLSIQFINNTATDGGNSLYVTPLYNCSSLPESSLIDLSIIANTSGLYSQLFNFVDTVKNSLTEITSLPEYICLCDNTSKVTPPKCRTTSDPVVVYPGQEFTLSVFPVDHNFNPVSSILFVDLRSTVHRLGRGQSSSQLRGGECTAVDLNLFGPQGSKTTIFLHARNGQSLLKIDVTIQECPPGFLLVERDESISCTCDPYIESLGRACNFTTFTITREQTEWLAFHEKENFSDLVYARTCPTGFCNSTISNVDLTVPDQLCMKGRTGLLCGACSENRSVVFGSPACRECSNYWFFTIFLYAAAGVILVVFLFLFNFTVAQGSINGISVIFYGNLISVNSNILFTFMNRRFLFIWISFLNLELGFPLCFYDGMTEAAKAGLQCIFPIYLLLITLAIILLSQRSRTIAKLTSSHGIQVLATLIYLSYSKMLRYVIDIFTISTLRGKSVSMSIWLFDGNMEYFTGSHTVIVIVPAAVTLIFIIIYTLMMIFIKQIEQRTSKLKPLLDAYGGPFKDQYRFWFGLRLLVLTVMCLTYALLGTDDPILAVIIQLLFLVLFMVLQAFVRPFRNQLMNALDLFFMLDLFFLLLYTVKLFDVPEQQQIAVVNSLVAVAFIGFVLLLVYHVYRFPRIYAKLHPSVRKIQRLRWSSVTSSCKERLSQRQVKAKGEVVEDQSSNIKLSTFNSVVERSLSKQESVAIATGGGLVVHNNVISSSFVSLGTSVDADTFPPPSLRFSQLREPILDDDY